MNYYIDNSNTIYHYINNGIINANQENFASDETVRILFEKLSSYYIPAIFKINKKSFCKSFTADEVEYIDPLDIGITDKKATLIYNIYKSSTNMIIKKIQKVAEILSESNEDLAKYLSLTTKQATNSEIKNIHSTYNYIVSKLNNNQINSFEKEYNRAFLEATKLNLKNANKLALMSAINKTGVKVE